MAKLDKRMIPTLGMMEWGSTKFHHTTQKGTQFKTYKLFTSGIFYLTFEDYG
jgi:hypothetical protein